LVHELKDAASAEAYCTLGGEAVSAKVAQHVGESCGLQQWASAFFASKHPAGKALPVLKGKIVPEDVKKELFRTLLEVYMRDGCGFCLTCFCPSRLILAFSQRSIRWSNCAFY